MIITRSALDSVTAAGLKTLYFYGDYKKKFLAKDAIVLNSYSTHDSTQPQKSKSFNIAPQVGKEFGIKYKKDQELYVYEISKFQIDSILAIPACSSAVYFILRPRVLGLDIVYDIIPATVTKAPFTVGIFRHQENPGRMHTIKLPARSWQAIRGSGQVNNEFSFDDLFLMADMVVGTLHPSPPADLDGENAPPL